MGLFGAENFLFFAMRVLVFNRGKVIVIRVFIRGCFGFWKDSTRFLLGFRDSAILSEKNVGRNVY